MATQYTAGLTAGQVLTAATMNSIGATEETWTITWTAATTNPSLGNGQLVGRYFRINKLVIAEMLLVAGSTTTFGSGGWNFSFPITPRSGDIGTYGFRSLGFGRAYDQSTGITYEAYPLFFASSTTAFRIIATGAGGGFSSAVPMTWASGDELTIQIIYEAA